LAALSDFRPQIQARDLVNFMSAAATRSVGEQATDRILTPNAMRNALPVCSESKLQAISEEDPRLAEVFDALKRLPTEQRRAPFKPEELGIPPAYVERLVATGAAMRIDDRYWLPEIYRHGLGFQNTVARPRVIQLALRARR
jgi:hypothetical protein